MSSSNEMSVPTHEALTADMMLGLKPSCPNSRSYRVNIPPNNMSVFTPSSTISIDIPTGRNGTWLDQSQTYLKFAVQFSSSADVTATNTSGIYLDNSAYSFIQRLDVYHQSNQLETINEYGQLANALLDTSLTMSDKAGLSSLIGTNANNTFVGAGATYSQFANAVPVQLAGDRSGLSVLSKQSISTATPYVFCLPLLSGVVGVNASKMLPLKDLSAPINLQFYLSANDDAIYYGTLGAGASWQIVNVELCCQFVEIIDERFNQVPHDIQYISSSTYRNSSTSLPSSSSGEISNLLGIRCASLTQLLARFRNQANATQGANGTAAYRKSSSINPNLSYYYFKIGSQLMPQKPVYLINGTTTSYGSEAFAELLKGFHSLSSNIGNSAITNNMYNVAQTASGGWGVAYVPMSKSAPSNFGTEANAFMIGLECQTFSNRNDTILSGVSTLNTPIYMTICTTSGATIGTNITLDVFAQMDMILCIQDGIMSAKY